MSKGEGKGWSRGLTAASDPRVSRAASALRGRAKTRRTPLNEVRWVRGTYTSLPICWSAPMAYVVGLIATDGCLISSRRAINFKSADRELVESLLALLGRTNHIGQGRTRLGGTVFKTQFGDTRLYRWLEEIGLTPRKSLTLGPISVPDEFLAAFVRGLLDGDGSITNGRWRADTARRDDYYYDWFRVRFWSASRTHLDWLRTRLRTALVLRGWISFGDRRGRPIGYLGYGKADSTRLLNWLYFDPKAPALSRKRAIWDAYRARKTDGPAPKISA